MMASACPRGNPFGANVGLSRCTPVLVQLVVIAHDNCQPLEVYNFIAVAYFAIRLPITMWRSGWSMAARSSLPVLRIEQRS